MYALFISVLPQAKMKGTATSIIYYVDRKRLYIQEKVTGYFLLNTGYIKAVSEVFQSMFFRASAICATCSDAAPGCTLLGSWHHDGTVCCSIAENDMPLLSMPNPK